MHGYFVASFPYFNGTFFVEGPTFVLVNRQNNEVRGAGLLQCGPVLRHSVDLWMQTYKELFRIAHMENSP